MPEPSQDAPTPAVCAFVQRTITAAMNRVRVARWIGEQAVTYGRREIIKAFEAGAHTPGPGDEPPDAAVVSDQLPTAAAQAAAVPVGDNRPAQPISPALADELATLTLTLDDTSTTLHVGLDLGVTSTLLATRSADGVPPFDGYDTLPAAHIVQRLARLTPVELAAVRAYELGHRGRRTVVAKVDQLLDAG